MHRNNRIAVWILQGTGDGIWYPSESAFLFDLHGKSPSRPVIPRERAHVERSTMADCRRGVPGQGEMHMHQTRTRAIHPRTLQIAKTAQASTEIPLGRLTLAPVCGLETVFGAMTRPGRCCNGYAFRAGQPGRQMCDAPQTRIDVVAPTRRATHEGGRETKTIARRSTLFHTAIPATTALNLISPNFCVLSSSCNPGVYVYFC
jgi:hypothetical protein